MSERKDRITQLRPSRLEDLVLSDREQRAYEHGVAHGKTMHQCPSAPVKRPYPHEIVSRLDDLADAAFDELGDAAYEPVQALDDWINGREEA